MKRIMRCCSCNFEEDVELPDDTTFEQLIEFGNEWRLKHQPNCNTDPIKDGTFPTTEISEKRTVVFGTSEYAVFGEQEEKLDPSCTLIISCTICKAEILCQYKIDNSSKGILPEIPEIKIPEDIDVSARLLAAADRSRCTLHDKIVGVHDQACKNKKLPFRLDDIRVPVIWRILGTTEQVCGTCIYFEALEKCIKEAVANGDLPIDSVCLEEG